MTQKRFNRFFFLCYLLAIFCFLLLIPTACQPVSQQSERLSDQRPEVLPQTYPHPDKIIFPPLQMTIPKPQRVELANGLVVYLLEDHELPLVEIAARLKCGSIYDQPPKEGLANLTTTLMRSGGTARFTPEELDEKLAFMGASLGVETDYEETNFHLSILSADLKEGLELLKSVLTEPVFSEDKLEFEKGQLAEAFRRENDRPGQIAEREFRRRVYAEHPYGNRVIGNADSVKMITREEIIGFYKKYEAPNNIFLGVAGDFRGDETIQLIKQAFGNWTKQNISRPFLLPLERRYKKSVNLFSKNIPQTSIMLGHIGVERTSPDYFPVMIMNAILGGSSVSRLYEIVREQKGLAYGIFSYFMMYRDLGMFIIETDTENKTVAQALSLILEEVNKIRQEPVRDEELKHTKDAILSGFVFRFTNAGRIIDQYIDIECIGLPSDYLETYTDKISKVTKEDILRVAREYLHPDDFIFIVVGNEKQFDKPLSEFGPVNIITK